VHCPSIAPPCVVRFMLECSSSCQLDCAAGFTRGASVPSGEVSCVQGKVTGESPRCLRNCTLRLPDGVIVSSAPTPWRAMAVRVRTRLRWVLRCQA
jgi:hypothetical protein